MSEQPIKHRGRPKGSKDKKPRAVVPGRRRTQIDTNDARPEEIARAIKNLTVYFNRPHPASDEEVAERINEYFRDCHEKQMIPTVEGMSLCIGVDRPTVWRWSQGEGCSAARREMIKSAKAILASLDAELVQAGKIPQVVYIFRAKNFYGMSDQQEITINAGNNDTQDVDVDEIAKRYLKDPNQVETEFVENAQNAQNGEI